MESIMLNEISHTEKDKCNMISLTCMCNLKNPPKQKPPSSWIQRTDGGGQGQRMGAGWEKRVKIKKRKSLKKKVKGICEGCKELDTTG